jgi:hypothetical protein
MNKQYDFNEHKHRYAVWTAARAIQRSFTNTRNISKAIDSTGLRKFAETDEIFTQDWFDIEQVMWCTQLIERFKAMGIPCSYGRAAKIVAIYLKTSVVLPSRGTANNATLIHPPVDSILLRSLARKTSMKHLRTMRWTKITVQAYLQLLGELRHTLGSFNWTLEEHWTPEAEGVVAGEDELAGNQ